jgi:hypothetical protein
LQFGEESYHAMVMEYEQFRKLGMDAWTKAHSKKLRKDTRVPPESTTQRQDQNLLNLPSKERQKKNLREMSPSYVLKCLTKKILEDEFFVYPVWIIFVLF